MSQIYSKDSFDRFGDDLCEEIISYLKFGKKVELECVSKQWKRTIYQKHHRLELALDKNCQITIIINNLNDSQNQRSKQISIKFIKIILNKCPNILYFSIKTLSYPSDFNLNESFKLMNAICYYINKIFRLVFKVCDKITSIKVPLFLISKKNIRELFYIFGPNLKSINFKNDLKLKNDLRRRPNVKLGDYSFRNLCYFLLDNDLKCVVNNLTHFAPPVIESIDSSILQTIFESNRSLQYIKLYSEQHYSDGLVDALNYVSKLKQLRALKVQLIECRSPQKLYQSLESVGRNCHNLTRLYYHEELPQAKYCKQLFESLQYFPNLTSLTIHIFRVERAPINFFSGIVSQYLSNSRDLSSLVLNIPGLENEFFTDIDTYFPRLNYLMLHETNIIIGSLGWISRLTRLQTIGIYSHFQSLNFFFTRANGKRLIKLFDTCPKLTIIYVRYSGINRDYLRRRDGKIEKNY